MTTFPFRIREIPILGVEALCQGPTPDMSPCVRGGAQNWLLSLWGRSTGRLVGPRSLNTTLASPLVPQWGSLLQFPIPCPCPVCFLKPPLFNSTQKDMHETAAKHKELCRALTPRDDNNVCVLPWSGPALPSPSSQSGKTIGERDAQDQRCSGAP